MAQPLTIEEIASLAEVSRSTVSRVLNEHPNVRSSVRARVLRVIRENNYAPRAAARSLASNRTQSIGILFPFSASRIFHDPFFAVLVQAIIEAANQRSYFVTISITPTDQEHEFYTKILRSRPFDGLVIPTYRLDDPLLPYLLRDQIPFVLCERHPDLPQASWIEIDNRTSARQVVEHLIGLGHCRIATITGPLRVPAGYDRHAGYHDALQSSGLSAAPELIVEGNFHPDSGYAAMKRLLSEPNPPTAVFAANDNMAIGALRAIREAGLRVPYDIALIGFDDLPHAELADVALTTMRQPISEIGAAAANLLIDQLEHQDFTPAHQAFLTELVVRDSCGTALSQSRREVAAQRA